MRNKVNICNIDIDNISMEEVLSMLPYYLERKIPSFFVTPNVDHIVRLQKDIDFLEIYKKSDLVLADGMPLLWAAKYLGTSLKEKISGSDIFPEICKLSVEKNYKVFFLGGRPGAAVKSKEVLVSKYIDLNIVGVYSPPFGFENDKKENTKIINMIKGAKPDILFVGLGSPKQEKWIYKYKDEYQVPVSIGIGVTFEFVAGMVRRAPVWMQKNGMEWLWRLLMEPKRLWKRYLVDDSVFFWLVIKQKILNSHVN